MGDVTDISRARRRKVLDATMDRFRAAVPRPPAGLAILVIGLDLETEEIEEITNIAAENRAAFVQAVTRLMGRSGKVLP